MSEIVPQEYDQFLGVDTVTAVPLRRAEQAQRMKNYQFLNSGSLSPRSGWQHRVLNSGGLGYVEYIRPDEGQGEVTRFDIGTAPLEVKEGTFTIVYSGASTTVVCQFLVDLNTNTWKFQVLEDDGTDLVEVLLEDVGVGVDEVSVTTLADLETAIEGISADYAVTIVGEPTTPAAFLPQLVNEVLEGSPLTLAVTYNYSLAFRTPNGSTAPFTNHQANRNDPSFRNATHINFRECLVIATDEDYPVKIDGQSAYLFGMARGALTSVTPGGGAGAITANWRYMVRYKHIDARLNVNPGSLSDIQLATVVALTNVAVVCPTLQVTSGYATDQAKVNGAQVGVNTITVDAGHQLEIGDVVTFLDTSVSALFATQRTVTGTAATTVTVDGAVVNVADNSIISNGLTIEIFRTKNNSGFFYYLADLPNDNSAASITFTDTIVDASIGDEFIEPDRQPDPPPKGGIIELHQNIPIITHNMDNPNRLYYADLLNPEGFPEATNYRDLYGRRGGEITAVAPNIAGLEVWFPEGHYRLVGEIVDEVFSFRRISDIIGCKAHATVRQLENDQIHWLSNIGPRWITPGGRPQIPGFGIDELVHQHGDESDMFVLEHAVAVDNPFEKMMLLYLPVEDSNSGNVYANSNSEVWVLDYKVPSAPRWAGPWTNINMAGGALCDDHGRLSFVERRFDAVNSNVVRNISYFHDRNDDFDQMDHQNPIESEYAPGWEDYGAKSRMKIFNWIRIYSMDINRLSGFTLTVRIERDWLEGTYVEFVVQIGIGGGASGWQFEPWGFFAWGMPTATFKQVKIPEEHAGAFASRPILYHVTGYEKPIISLYALGVQAPWAEGLKNRQQ